MEEFYKISNKTKDKLLANAKVSTDKFNEGLKTVLLGDISIGVEAKDKAEAIKKAEEWLESLPLAFGVQNFGSEGNSEKES